MKRYKNKRFFLICGGIYLFSLFSCTNSNNGDINDKEQELPNENVTINIIPDKTRIIHNPLNGWVLYLARGMNESFWESTGYDHMYVPDLGKYVKVSDYAGICYLRTNWRTLEPEQGKYAWDDPNSDFSRLMKSVRDRGKKMAFRVLVDGRDQQQNTPDYVFDAGAEYYGSPRSPYPDDKTFQSLYDKFVEAFAEKYDNPDEVDFIDGYGLGKWGESHAMVYLDENNKKSVMEWITGLYSRCFKKVPLVINYHRMIGDTNQSSWSETVPEDAEELLNIAINNGYILRHDAFGMTDYYKDWEKQFAARWNFKLPILMEGGWITGGTHRYWIDSSGKYREGHPEDVRKGEFEASMEAHVNTMDFRYGTDTESWFSDAYSYVQQFISEGGYRLYPDMISLPNKLTNTKDVVIVHRWNNLGWGYCPTNIRAWNQKYKVAFALMSEEDKIVKIFVDEQTDLSTWLKGNPTTYTLNLNLKGIPVGAYFWCVGLVDVTNDNCIGLNMSVPKDGNLLDSGWLKLSAFIVE